MWRSSSEFPTNHHPKLELFPGLAGACAPSCPFCCFLSRGNSSWSCSHYWCLCYSTFSCTYFFFCQDWKLLRVQHCTYLPFVNDLDLLKTKIFLKSPMDRLPYPLRQLWQMVLQTWLNDKTRVVMDQSSGPELHHCIHPPSTYWVVLVISSLSCCYSSLRAQSAPLTSDPKLRCPW